MIYQCPKGHQSTDADYCSECGALIGQPKVANASPLKNTDAVMQQASFKTGKEICPDCGTPREGDSRFCEVCRHDFQDNTKGVAEAIVASQQPAKPAESGQKENNAKSSMSKMPEDVVLGKTPEAVPVVSEKLNIIITVDKDKVLSWDGESPIKPDTVDRVFPLDLDENLVGRRSQSKGIYPEIEINDPGVSHRHLKFIKQSDGAFAVLELGSSNGTELNGTALEPGVNTVVKSGDELAIGIWTRLKIMTR